MTNAPVFKRHSDAARSDTLIHESHQIKSFCTEIISISSSLVEFIPNYSAHVRIVGQFDRALNVIVDESLITFVLLELLNGPFHIVVRALPSSNLSHDASFKRSEQKMEIGEWSFAFTNSTQQWNPEPRWEDFRFKPHQFDEIKHKVNRLIRQQTAGNMHSTDTINHILTPSRIEVLGRSLRRGNSSDIVQAVQPIIGRGPGLTPTGDDFLAGVMLSLWALHHSNAKSLCKLIADSALQRTTHISLAYFKAIAEGLADERWHNLFNALSTNNSRLLESAVSHILTFGATSGSDMLAGFVWGIEMQTSGANSLKI